MILGHPESRLFSAVGRVSWEAGGGCVTGEGCGSGIEGARVPVRGVWAWYSTRMFGRSPSTQRESLLKIENGKLVKVIGIVGQHPRNAHKCEY